MKKVTINLDKFTELLNEALLWTDGEYAVLKELEESRIKTDNIYEKLLNVEEALSDVVVTDGTRITREALAEMKSMDPHEIKYVLDQVQVLKVFLNVIEESASAVQMDLKDK